MIHDIDRPDVDGTAPKMQEIADKVEGELVGLAPYLNVGTDDNIMSSVYITGSYDKPEDWTNDIYYNSRHFRFSIVPMSGKRYYDPADKKVTVVLEQKHYKIEKKFRKYTGPVDKVIEKIKKWIED